MGGPLLGSLRVLAAVEEFENIELFEKGSYAIRMHVEANEAPGHLVPSSKSSSSSSSRFSRGAGDNAGGSGTISAALPSRKPRVATAGADDDDGDFTCDSARDATLAMEALHELLRGGTSSQQAASSASSSGPPSSSHLCSQAVLSNADAPKSPRAKNLTSEYRAGYFPGSGQLIATGMAHVSAQTNSFYVTYKRDTGYFDTAISCTAHAPLEHLLQPDHAPLSLRLELLMLHTIDGDSDEDDSGSTTRTETEILASRTINIWGPACQQRVWAGRVEFDFLHMCSISVMVSCLLTGVAVPAVAPPLAPPSPTAMRLDECVQARLRDALCAIVSTDAESISRFVRLRSALTTLFATTLQAIEEQYDAHHLCDVAANKAARAGGGAASITARLASIRGMLRGILATPVPTPAESKGRDSTTDASHSASNSQPVAAHSTSPGAVPLAAVRLLATQLAEAYEELDALVAVLHTVACFNDHVFHHAKAACTHLMQGLLSEGVYVEDLPTGRLVTEAAPEFGGHRAADLAQAVLRKPLQLCVQRPQIFTVVEEPTRPEESAVLFVQRLTAPWYHPRSSTAASSHASTCPTTPRKASNKAAFVLTAGSLSPPRPSTAPGAASGGARPSSLAKRLSRKLLRSPQRHMYGRRTSDCGADTQGMIDLAYPAENEDNDDDREDGLDIVISEDVFVTADGANGEQRQDSVVVVDTRRQTPDQDTAPHAYDNNNSNNDNEEQSQSQPEQQQQQQQRQRRRQRSDNETHHNDGVSSMGDRTERTGALSRSSTTAAATRQDHVEGEGARVAEASDTCVSDIDVDVIVGTDGSQRQSSVCSSVDVEDGCGAGCGRGRWPFPRLRSSRRRKRNMNKESTSVHQGNGEETGVPGGSRRPCMGSASPSHSAGKKCDNGSGSRTGDRTDQSANPVSPSRNSNPYRARSPQPSSSTLSRTTPRKGGASVRKRPTKHASLLRVLLATQLQDPLATAAAACAPFPPAVAAALADTVSAPRRTAASSSGPVVPPAATSTVTDSGKGHLFVCVHGLEGNQYDLRNMRLKIQQWLPNAVFLMWSEEDTHRGVAAMAESLVGEIESHVLRHNPTHISFIGHSLGNLVIREALCSPRLDALIDFDGRANAATACDSAGPRAREKIRRPSLQGVTDRAKLHAYISLCAPHCGAVHLSGLVSTGLWFMSKLTRSVSIPELQLKDGGRQLRDSRLYRLRHNTRLGGFHHIVLVASPQDGYVSLSSALLTPEPRSGSGTRQAVFEEMRTSLLREMLSGPHTTLTRCQVMFPPSKSRFSLANAIGRAAHVAMLDSDRFLAKFVLAHLHVLVRPPAEPASPPPPPPPHSTAQTSIV